MLLNGVCFVVFDLRSDKCVCDITQRYHDKKVRLSKGNKYIKPCVNTVGFLFHSMQIYTDSFITQTSDFVISIFCDSNFMKTMSNCLFFKYDTE